MSIQILLNKLESEWWLDLGISIQKTDFNTYKYLITLGFLLFTIYFRFIKRII
jgi:hypothetical protein